VIISKKLTPVAIDKKSHSTLFITYFSTAADIVDVAEYIMENDITELFSPEIIWGFKNYFARFLFEKYL
jgi:hypothetical protein